MKKNKGTDPRSGGRSKRGARSTWSQKFGALLLRVFAGDGTPEQTLDLFNQMASGPGLFRQAAEMLIHEAMLREIGAERKKQVREVSSQ